MSTRLPPWLKQKAPDSSVMAEMEAITDGLSLHTVCEEARCPNRGTCFSQGTATFLIMGNSCTRNCRFCAIKKGKPLPIDPDEPRHVALIVSKLRLKHVVITSVTRDDLPDGGAGYFAKTIRAIRESNPETTIEVLIPDFMGSLEALKIVVDSSPEVINHNVETVPRLYPEVRPKADFHRSLNLVKKVKSLDSKIVTKSGIMLGLGEQDEETIKVMEELRKIYCDILTLGQYLRPSPQHHPVVRYVTENAFEEYKCIADELGFKSVASGCFVRSSFNALSMYQEVIKLNRATGL
ncbi:lipoyl synthase [Chloroflexota bacterium]